MAIRVNRPVATLHVDIDNMSFRSRLVPGVEVDIRGAIEAKVNVLVELLDIDSLPLDTEERSDFPALHQAR